MNKLFISIFECFYLIYMFHFFKTRTDLNIFVSPKNWLLKHNTDNDYSLRICPFGQIAVFVLIFVILGRHFINIPKNIIKLIFGLSVILSLVNFNALVYLLPIWIIELIS